MHRRFAAMIVASCTTVLAASAQTYAVKKCEPPIEPLGVLHAQGQIAYRLSKDGKPDTGSIRVVSLRGISAGGLRSAAVRELSRCQFDRSADTTHEDVFVVDAIGFDSSSLAVSAATVVASSIVTIDVTPHPALPVDPIEAIDSTVEERPRRLGCDRQADIPQFVGSFRTRQERDAAFAAWQRQNSGTALARITVEFDGRVSPNSVVITSLNNPAMHTVFVEVLASCRYVPGRIAGIPVATIVATRTAIGSPTGPP